MQPFNFAPIDMDWWALSPFIIMALTGVIAMMVDVYRPNKNNNAVVGVSLVGLVVTAFFLLTQVGTSNIQTAAGMILRDSFSLTANLILVLGTFITILFSEAYLREKRIPYGEFYPLMIWSTLGAMLMSSSYNLLMLFVGLEVLSIALYVLTGMARTEEKAEESAIKYFLLGCFASAFFLYGIAFVYGATGTLNLTDIGAAWDTRVVEARVMLSIGMGLMLISLAFKSSLVPFHQWTPDVYQGAPTNVTAFMAAGSKIAAMAALFRVLETSGALQREWMPALTVLAILTMTVGNLMALVQKDVKRILGYSAISHAGYLMVGMLAHFKDPLRIPMNAVLYYLFAYTLMTVGAFAVISLVAKSGGEETRLKDLNGLYKHSPLAAISLLVFILSLIGIPPTIGFVGKLQIFQDAMTTNLQLLAIVLAANSAISVYYYLGILKAALIDEPEEPVRAAPMSVGLAAACILCVAGVIGAGFFQNAMYEWVGLPTETIKAAPATIAPPPAP